MVFRLSERMAEYVGESLPKGDLFDCYSIYKYQYRLSPIAYRQPNAKRQKIEVVSSICRLSQQSLMARGEWITNTETRILAGAFVWVEQEWGDFSGTISWLADWLICDSYLAPSLGMYPSYLVRLGTGTCWHVNRYLNGRFHTCTETSKRYMETPCPLMP